MKNLKLPDTVSIETIVDDEGYTIGYYARGTWNFNSVRNAAIKEYDCDREGYSHGYFRFIPSPDHKNMMIKVENESKRGNFPVTYIWY